MTNTYQPKQYWEARLGQNFNLRGVGHISYSAGYNAWLYRRKLRCIKSCLNGLSLSGKDVLDIGCGTGFFVDWYLQQGAKVCGIDITDTSVNNLRQKFINAEFQTADIGKDDYQPVKQFDIVNMWDVIYHIVEPDAFGRTFDNIARSLKTGGLLLFTDWFGTASDARIANHVQSRCLATYQELLPKLGLRLEKSLPLYHYLNKTNLPRFDNHLSAIYFLLDNCSRSIAKNNLSLTVWKYN